MSGTANPIDLITGLATTANVSKADISAWAKARVSQVLANASEVRSTNLLSQLMVTLNSTGALLFLDAADHTTADDGVNCIISFDGGRFKPKTALLPPTAVSLGGVFSSSAASHNFANGVDTSGNVTYARPALADLSDGLSMDTDGTLSANSDLHIASQKAVKSYVDTVAQGLDPKQSVLVATTANITLSGEQTIDGVLTSASRILVKNQTTQSQNGIYITGSGSWTRSLDADSWAELPGAFLFVEQGTANDNTGWTCTVNAGGTLGSTAITFVQFSGAGTYTNGTGLSLTGTVFAIDATVATLAGSQAFTNKSYNGNTWTAGTGILTLSAGKTLAASNTLTLTGTDGSSIAFGTGGTVLYSGGALGTPVSATLTNATGLPLAGLTTQAAFSFAGNNTSGTAALTAVTIGGLTAKTTPVSTDLLMISDQAASGAWKKSTIAQVVGALASGVSSIAGNTGAFTLGIGLTNTVNDVEVSLTKLTNSLGSDVALTTNVFATGPSVAQGTSGTWLVMGTVTFVDSVAASAFNIRLWDGTTVIASTTVASLAATTFATASLSGVITSPAGNLRIDVEDTTAGNHGTIKFNASGLSKDSTITAVRIG